MKEIIVTGKTIEDAVDKAIIELGVLADDITYEVLEMATSGFLGFGAKPTKILAKTTLKNEDKKEISKKPQITPTKPQKPIKFEEKIAKKEVVSKPVARPDSKPFIKPEVTPMSTQKPVIKPEVAPIATQKIEDTPFSPSENAVPFLENYLTDLFKNMLLKISVSIVQKGRFIEVNLTGEDVGAVIGKHGDTLDSIQHIAQLAFNKAINGAEKVRIDTEGYREKREKTLIGLAKSIANRVIKSRGKYELEPMKAYERRIIHSALQTYPMLTTYSVGVEPQRRIVVAFKHRDR